MSHLLSGSDSQSTRRNFLKTSGVVAGSLAIGTQLSSAVHAAGQDGELRVGLVGCGGRGTGAAKQALTADPRNKLVAMGDVFQSQLDSSLKTLLVSEVKDQVVVDEGHKFVGFDAYKQVIDSCDVVLLTSTPHFRPRHLRYAVEADKHVFAEKPVAVDGPGIQSVLESARMAKEKNLSLVSGLCWRYHDGMRATFDQIHQGTAGDITSIQATYNSNGVWEPRRTRDEVESEMEYQLRNWYYYTWLSGDFNTEQHVHSLDKVAWAMNDETPVKVTGSGGRQQRTDPKYGNIYDHFNVVYEYANGVKAFCSCRHFRGCASDVSDHVFGTKGKVDVMAHKINNHAGEKLWKFRTKRGEKRVGMYQQEHNELFASIRSGNPINNGYYMSMSSMMAIAGRMASYTGKSLTWDECMNSKEVLGPDKYEWGAAPEVQVAIPGITQFV